MCHLRKKINSYKMYGQYCMSSHKYAQIDNIILKYFLNILQKNFNELLYPAAKIVSFSCDASLVSIF